MPAANVTGLEGVASNITFLDQCTLEPYSLNYASLRYIPNLGANAAFGGIFVISLVAQIILWFSYRTHSYTFSMICGLILEVVGYAFRIAMRNHMFKEGPFLMYVSHQVHDIFCQMLMLRKSNHLHNNCPSIFHLHVIPHAFQSHRPLRHL